MVHRKIYYIIIIVFLCFAFSCKKRPQKEPSFVTIYAENPVTSEPISGIQFVLREYLEVENGQLLGNDDLEETEDSPVISGETDANGNASFDLYKKRDHDFAYVLTIDYFDMDVPPGDYEILSGGDKYFLEQHEREHNFNFEIAPIVKFVTHKKNYNCQGVNDLMKHRIKFLYTGSGDWTSWQYGFQGCYESLSDVKTHLMEVFVTELEVTREDGTIENIIDTSRIGINEIDTIKYYY